MIYTMIYNEACVNSSWPQSSQSLRKLLSPSAGWNTRYDFNRRKQSEEFQLCKSLVIKLSSD